MKILTFLLLSVAAYGQQTINAPAVSLDATGAAAVQSWMSGQTTGVSTTLAVTLAPGDTSVTLTSATGFAAGSAITIDGEHMQASARTANVLTVTRGVNGTTAAAHTSGAAVAEMKYKTINALGKSIIVDTLKQIVAAYSTVTAPVATAQATATAAVTAAVQ
jgi:hypothetical protein